MGESHDGGFLFLSPASISYGVKLHLLISLQKLALLMPIFSAISGDDKISP